MLHLREEDSVGDFYHVIVEKLAALTEWPGENRAEMERDDEKNRFQDEMGPTLFNFYLFHEM